MLRRLFRSAIVFAVLVAAYNAYVLWAVPQMEPSLAIKQQRKADRKELEIVNQAPSKYQLLLSNYFPKNHWSQTRPPKVIANSTEQAMLVFDEFKRHPAGEGNPNTLVDIERIAFLIFPTPPREGITPPRDAIILEAPQGAHLEFDDFRPEVGHIGQIVRGEFPGLIRIHSDMREEGPEDDLLIETSDVQMNTKLMYTSAPVRFRMGQNVGGGRELEIRFLADEHLKSSDSGLKIAGIDSLEIRREVRMRLEFDTSRLLRGGKDANATPPRDKKSKPYTVNPSVQVADASAVPPASPKPPVEASCTGPFTFDFVRYVASLDRDVELRQLNPNGPSDQLVCTRLDIHFAPKPPANGAARPALAEAEMRQKHELGQLEPVAVVAEGHPVVITSPAREVQVRGDRIQIALKDQRVRISGGNDAMLVKGPNVLQAPIIDYQHPTREEETAIGRFRATGPGSLRYVNDPAKPQQMLQAQWQTSVQLGREKGQPVLALDGRPKIAFGEAGALTADQIRMYLRELEGTGTEGIAIGSGNGKGPSKFRLAPDRLLATGRVEVASPQFTGRTQQLSTTFRIQPPADAGTGDDGKAEKPSVVPGGAKPANASPGAGQPSQTYYIDADQMRLEVLMKGQAATPTALTCDGHIVLREVPLVPTDQQPLEIHGGQLIVERLDTKTPHVTLHGAGATGSASGTNGTGAGGTNSTSSPQLAQLAGRGMTMLVDTVEADGGDSRVWSDGPGRATLQVSRNMAGQQTATPVPMEITWQNGFRFDGQTIVFNQGVVVAGMDSTLHCDRLAAKLATKVRPGQMMDQANMNPSEIECIGRVTMENVTRDTMGVTSHSLVELARLSINQQTGVITGQGPGTIRSTRFGTGIAALPGQPAATSAPANGAGNKLNFLRVEFHSGLDGNMYTRELTFHERVRTVYGPVDSWEQELDLARPETLSPDCLTLTSDDLRLNEDPLAARAAANPTDGGQRPVGPVQMRATGDVRIAGHIPGQGEFSVQADSASYDTVKQVFVLEGDTRTPAKLWRRNSAGVNSPPLEARRIRYSSATNAARVEGIQNLEITPSDLQNARRPTPVK